MKLGILNGGGGERRRWDGNELLLWVTLGTNMKERKINADKERGKIEMAGMNGNDERL